MLSLKRLVFPLFIPLLFLALSGCDALAPLDEPPRKVVVEVQSLEAVPETEAVLLHRFGDYLPSLLSGVDADVEGRRITFTFKRGAPPRDAVTALIERQGRLKVRAESGQAWYAAGNIEDAAVSKVEAGFALNMKLTSDGTEAMVALTNENIGRLMTLELDGEVLRRAIIREILGKAIQLPLPMERDALQLIAVMLRSGPLPEPVRIVSNEL